MPELDPDVFGGFNVKGDDEVFGGFNVDAPLREAVGSSGKNPEQAAKSINLSNETGVPARVIHADPDGFIQQKRSAEASRYVQSNQHIAGFIGSYPLGAEVAIDDYDNMDKLSKTGTELNNHPILKNILEGMREGFGETPLVNITPEQREAFPNLSKAMEPLVPLVQFPEAAMRVINSAIHGGATGLEELLKAGGVSDTTAQKVKREAINFVNFLMVEQMGKGGEGLAKAGFRANLNAAERAYIESGKTPPPGTGQVTDHIHNIQAHTDAAKMDQMVQDIETSKMKERSPPALEAYLDRVLGDREVSIAAEKVQELYKETSPGPNDGVLNITPEQLDLAHAAGADVNIKLSKLLAELDLAQYGELRDSIRFRKEGVTLEEAKELDLEPPEPPEKIKSAAIKIGDQIFEGPTHGEAAIVAEKALGKEIDSSIESDLSGFITDKGRYVSRQEAISIAKNAEQFAEDAEMKEAGYDPTVLVTEDMTTEARKEIRKSFLTKQAVKRSFYFQPLFENAKAVGMDEAQFKRYFDRFVEAENKDFQRTLAREELIRKRELAPEWKAAERQIRQDVTTEFQGLDLINQVFNGAMPKAEMKARVDAEVQARLESRFGGNLSNLVLDEAREAALASHYVDLMIDEYNIIGKNLPEGKPISIEDVKRWVKDSSTPNMRVKDLDYETFRRSAERAYKNAAKAATSGKFDEALKAQQQRIVSTLQAREALAFSKKKIKAEKVFDNITGNDAIKRIAQEHLDHAHQILRDIGYTDKEFQAPKIPLPEFIAGSDGQLAIADWIVNRERLKYDDLKVSEFDALDKSITSLMHAGRKERILESAHAEALVEDVARDVEKELERFNFIEQPPEKMKSLLQRAGSAYRKWTGMNMLVERMLDYSDKFSRNGPITRFLDRRMRDSYSTELRLQEKVKEQLAAQEKFVDNSVNDPIANRYIKDPLMNGGYMPMNRQMLRNFIRYMGSESGIMKVTKGFNIDLISAFNLIRENATKMDFDWANGRWKIYDGLWPEAAALERRVTGVEPDRIEPRPFVMKLKDGTEVQATGGYAKINYDKARSDINQKLSMRNGTFDNYYRTAIETPHGYTESRTAYAGYLDLSGLMEKSDLQSMIHDIAFREAVIDAKKLINNDIFKNAMQTRWGVERYNLMDGWLRDIANAHNFDDTYLQGAAAWMAAIRQNVVSTLIFLNPRTAVKHGGTAAFVSAAQTGPKEFMSSLKDLGIGDIFGSAKDLIMSKRRAPPPDAETMQAMKDVTDLTEKGKSIREFIWASSPLMRNRQGPYMDTIRGAFDRATDYGWQQAFKEVRAKSFDIGRSLVAFSDAISAMPQWWAEYKKNMSATGDHAESVFQADRAVTRTHGSNFIGDKPRVLRAPNTFYGELFRWFTPLMNFWLHTFNNNLQLTWDMQARTTRGAGSEPGAYFGNMGKRFVASVIVPIILEEVAAPMATHDEHGGIGRKMFLATLRYLGSFQWGLRDFTNAAAGGYEPSVGLLGTLYKGWYNAVRDAQRYGAGSTVSRNWVLHLATALGFATGLGGSEIGRLFTPPRR